MRLKNTTMTAVLTCVVALSCQPDPATPSDTIEYAIQFTFEFAVEVDEDADDHIARARLYDVAQIYDFLGNAGTVELAGGDEIYADGVLLDIETHTVWGNILRVDYSQSIAAGKDEYLFEFVRPDGERVEALIPIPEPFVVEEIGEVTDPSTFTVIEWSPVIEGATVNISLKPLTDNCLTIIGGDTANLVLNLDDTGQYIFYTDNYHSSDHDCVYELIFTRRFVESQPASWFIEGIELPISVWGIGLYTTRTTFVAKQSSF